VEKSVLIADRKEPESHPDEFPPDEAARRRDELARRLLKTPPQPQVAKPGKRRMKGRKRRSA
jgi:hypothetical protein